MNVKIRIFDEYVESTYETVEKIVVDYSSKLQPKLSACLYRASYRTIDGIMCEVYVGKMGEPHVDNAGYGTIEIRAPDEQSYGPIRVTIFIDDGDFYVYWKGLIGLLRHNIEPLVEIPMKMKKYAIEDEPWKQIEDEYDRLLVKLWWNNYPLEKIAPILNLEEGTIRNKLTELRKKLGKNIVPYRKNP